MSSITISLPEERLKQLHAIAKRYQIAPEDLVRVSIEAFLSGPDEAFERAVKHILSKNADLYRRLA